MKSAPVPDALPAASFTVYVPAVLEASAPPLDVNVPTALLEFVWFFKLIETPPRLIEVQLSTKSTNILSKSV